MIFRRAKLRNFIRLSRTAFPAPLSEKTGPFPPSAVALIADHLTICIWKTGGRTYKNTRNGKQL
ncbi:MAG: hypothetical protein D6714_08730 [Bacteroidetes bacterium]|nr:MAG: hypothetical protein D6714_08730 [Bacteroidota bacterium]